MKPWLTALALLITASAQAHDPGVSNATLTCDSERITIQLNFPTADLAPLCPDFKDASALQQLAAQSIEWQTANGPAPLTVVSAAQTDATSIEFTLTTPHAPGRLGSLLLAEFPRGHRQVLVLRDAAGETSRIEMLSASTSTQDISAADLQHLAPAPATEPAVQKAEIRPGMVFVGIGCFIASYLMHRRQAKA